MKSLLLLIVIIPLLGLGAGVPSAAAEDNPGRSSILCRIMPWFCDWS
ncbi:hypothetical protein [Micropruina sonneratiae]|nr:hypothetical protein [Micropruina sp. KQZ13P-5]MCW3156523.1 hypothetical protein [Micropruina sp. KQZ13P-5]